MVDSRTSVPECADLLIHSFRDYEVLKCGF